MSKHSMRTFIFLIAYNILLCSTCCFYVGCAVDKGKVYEKNGKTYGKTGGLFKAEWDDYYLRGISYSEGSYWKDAAADFAVAIEKRYSDQRRARTYGMHFIDYYPHRELGIAYFNLKQFRDAIRSLETSLESVDTARAKFYLDKARRAWLEETRLDTTQPALSVSFPPPEHTTNGFSVTVKGTARDDYFVSNLIFNGEATTLELSQKEVAFQEEFSLRHGKNVITLQSEDILGKTSTPLTIEVKVDREGPLVFLEITKGKNDTISIRGALYDTSNIAQLRINNIPLAVEQARFVEVYEQFTAGNTAQTPSMQFEAVDSIGNKTTGSLIYTPSTPERTASSIMTLPQVASSKPLAAGAARGAVTPTSEIDIRGLKDGLTLYRDTITVNGTVRTGKGINDLRVNRESLLHGEEDTSIAAFIELLKEKHGRPLAFSKTIHLDEGDNTITTSLTDTGGEMTRKDLSVTRNIPRVRKISSRLSVAIFPFDERKKIKETLRDYVQTFLNRSFIEQKRFNVLERARLSKTLEQQRIPRETLFNQDTAVRLGSLMNSETVLVGTIATSPDAIEITAHLVDTETSRVIVEKDVYWEGKLTGGFRGILDRLALKFKQHIPLCEGNVTQTMPDDVIIDLGTNHAIQQGMKFLAFSEGATRIDPETGMDLGSETDIIGLLSAKEIDQKFSKAGVVKKFTESGIHTGSRVIAQ